jgi:hypothetical protein
MQFEREFYYTNQEKQQKLLLFFVNFSLPLLIHRKQLKTGPIFNFHPLELTVIYRNTSYAVDRLLPKQSSKGNYFIAKLKLPPPSAAQNEDRRLVGSYTIAQALHQMIELKLKLLHL